MISERSCSQLHAAGGDQAPVASAWRVQGTGMPVDGVTGEKEGRRGWGALWGALHPVEELRGKEKN